MADAASANHVEDNAKTRVAELKVLIESEEKTLQKSWDKLGIVSDRYQHVCEWEEIAQGQHERVVCEAHNVRTVLEQKDRDVDKWKHFAVSVKAEKLLLEAEVSAATQQHQQAEIKWRPRRDELEKEMVTLGGKQIDTNLECLIEGCDISGFVTSADSIHGPGEAERSNKKPRTT